jgi:hypothetical protein
VAQWTWGRMLIIKLGGVVASVVFGRPIQPHECLLDGRFTLTPEHRVCQNSDF